jgi:hypothetical protein
MRVVEGVMEHATDEDDDEGEIISDTSWLSPSLGAKEGADESFPSLSSCRLFRDMRLLR